MLTRHIHVIKKKKKSTVPPHTLNLNTNLESLLLFFKQLSGPESKINRRHSFAWFCYQIGGLFPHGDFFCPFFFFSFLFFYKYK